MPSSRCSSARPQTLTALCVQIMCLAGWPLSSEAARLRCGSDLLSDLIFVCGDHGIYFGKGSWSGYGARPRGKGIVDQCCRQGGCELQYLEKYCAKPSSPQRTTIPPATSRAAHTTISPATTTAAHTTISPATTTAAHNTTTTTPLDTAQQFEAVFHKRLLEQMGAPDSPKRESYRKRTQPSVQRRGKGSSSNRRSKPENTSSRPPSASRRGMRFKS